MELKTPKIQESKNPRKLKETKGKIYNLEQRLSSFFQRVLKLCRKIPLNSRTNRIVSQLTASSGSVAANYAEASEAMSKKDFIKSFKICRKEAKESKVWLMGLKIASDTNDSEFESLAQEATEFIYIFTSIIKNAEQNR